MGRLIRTDIVVVGAGLAGVCAAVAAARRGARVTLIEKESHTGGTVVGLRHRSLCGLFLNSSGVPRKYLNPGLTAELCGQLSPEAKASRMGKVWVLPIDPDRLVKVLADLLSHEKNIRILYRSTIDGCHPEGPRIMAVEYSCRGRRYQLEADVYIDASAGVLLQKCGAQQPGTAFSRQMSGYTLEVSGAPWDEALPIKVPYTLYQAVKRGDLPQYARWTSVSPFGVEQKNIHLKLSLPASGTLPLARMLSAKILKTLSRELPVFRSAKIVWRAEGVFFRDGAQLLGKYILKDKDVLCGQRFPDAVLKGAWPMEFWNPERGPTYQYSQNSYYEMPLRCLEARDVMNLLAVGRSVSAEPGAQASLRVGGLCIAMGVAAGQAAVDRLEGL